MLHGDELAKKPLCMSADRAHAGWCFGAYDTAVDRFYIAYLGGASREKNFISGINHGAVDYRVKHGHIVVFEEIYERAHGYAFERA